MESQDHYKLLNKNKLQNDYQVHTINEDNLDIMLNGALTSFQYEENNLAEIQIKQDRDEKYTALIDSSLHPSKFVSKTNSPR